MILHRLEGQLFEEIVPLLEINSARGKLINIDTLDGAGNSTQAALLARYLRERGLDVVLTAEPTDKEDGEYGKAIRRILQKERTLPPLPLQQLYCVDRGDHLDRLILPALNRGDWVLTARYSLSTLAYGMASGVPAWQLLAMNVGYPWPNLNIVLVVPVEECLSRIEERKKGKELFESALFLRKTLEAYHCLAGKLPCVELVSGVGTEEEVATHVRQLVDRWFFLSPAKSNPSP